MLTGAKAGVCGAGGLDGEISGAGMLPLAEKLSAAADVHAFGVLMLELAAGAFLPLTDRAVNSQSWCVFLAVADAHAFGC